MRENRHRIDYQEGTFRVALSSSDVRTAVAEGRPLTGLVPPRVAETIAELELYSSIGPDS